MEEENKYEDLYLKALRQEQELVAKIKWLEEENEFISKELDEMKRNKDLVCYVLIFVSLVNIVNSLMLYMI